MASKVNTSSLYASVAYYSRDNCVSVGDMTGCTTDYSVSDIKQVVDIWKENYASGVTEARLITLQELVDSFGYKYDDSNPTIRTYNKTSNTPSFVYSNNYGYWTMSPYEDSDSEVWRMDYGGILYGSMVEGSIFNEIGSTVRPVIVLSKSAL